MARNQYSETAIRKRLCLDALQHPMTILPAALCGLSLIYLSLLSDILGGRTYVIVLFFCSTALASGSFLWHYNICYENAYVKRIRELADCQDRHQREKHAAVVKQLVETVRAGFRKIDSANGTNALTDLVCEYRKLLQVIRYKREIDSLSLVHIPILTEETFLQGLGALSDALELAKIIHPSDIDNLEKKLSVVKNEIEWLRRHNAESPLLEIKKASFESYKERLELVKQQSLQYDLLLYQCMQCEASLHKTCVELAALKTENSDMNISSLTERLQLTIKQAKEIQEEFKRLGCSSKPHNLNKEIYQL